MNNAMMIKNCINCGAVLTGNKCEYCDTVYDESFSADISDEFCGELKYKGRTYKVYMADVENDTISDCYRDEHGLLRGKVDVKRKFTLIEY